MSGSRGVVSGSPSQSSLPMDNQSPSDRRSLGKLGPPCAPTPSQYRILEPGGLSSPSSEVIVIYGMAGLPVFAHKGPALGPCHAGRHSSAFLRPQPSPDNSAPSLLRRVGLCEQSSLDSRAALTPEEFQKWYNARPAWASQATA